MSSTDPRYLLVLAAAALLLRLCPAGRIRLALLTVGSFAFCAALSPGSATLLVYITVVSYVGGIGLSGLPEGRARGAAFVALVIFLLAPLVAFKYPSMLVGAWQPRVAAIGLPVGLSFFTFQALGYLIDVRIGTIAAERRPLLFAAFMSFFPRLAAGPIERSRHFLPQLGEIGVFNYQRAVSGLRALLTGLFMKIIIADTLAPIVESVYRQPHGRSPADIALATCYFSFQVYADFAGYSLVAIGSGRLLGIELLQNFDQPYFSESLPEFWRRWHMSLSGWFRDYVFTPLQFQWRRMGVAGLGLALLLTFTLIGIWHGSGWNYVLFGLIHGVLIAGGTITAKRRDRWRRQLGLTGPLTHVLRALITFGIVTLTFIVFRSSDLQQAWWMFRQLTSLAWGHVSLPIAVPAALVAILLVGDLVARTANGFGALPVSIRWTLYHAAAIALISTLIGRFLLGTPSVNYYIYYKF